MSTKKIQKKRNEEQRSISQLSYEDYCSILRFAEKIRNENKEKITRAKEPKEKQTLLEQLFSDYEIAGSSSSSTLEREKAVILKINIFIPDNEEFLRIYDEKDKNIRLISEQLNVPAPYVISKIAELHRYESYLKQFMEEQKTISTTPSSKEIKSAPISKEISPSDAIAAQLSKHMESMQSYNARLLETINDLDEDKKYLQQEIADLKNKNHELQMVFQKEQMKNKDLEKQLSDSKKGKSPEQQNKIIEDLEQKNHELQDMIRELRSALRTAQTKVLYLEGQNDNMDPIQASTVIDQDPGPEILINYLRSQQKKEQRYRAAEEKVQRLQNGMAQIVQEIDGLNFTANAKTPENQNKTL